MVFLFLRRSATKNLIHHSFVVITLSIILFFFNQFGSVIEYDKLEVFYFSRSTKNINPPLLDLRPAEDALLRSKNTWWYLEFFFNKKLPFQHYIHYYINKALSITKGIKMLGNLTRGLSLMYKCFLYRTCVLCQTYKVWTQVSFNFIFLFYFLFDFSFKARVRV